MVIKKKKNEYDGFDIDLIDEGKVLSIMQTGADYTWVIKKEIYSHITELDFQIPATEGELYPLFLNLYERIISGNVMGYDQNSVQAQEYMQMETITTWYKDVVSNGVITIMCDAYPLAVPNILTIKKEDGAINLGFKKIESEHEYKSKYHISINIRQSGSRIYDLAFPFELLFRELQLVNESTILMKKIDTKNI